MPKRKQDKKLKNKGLSKIMTIMHNYSFIIFILLATICTSLGQLFLKIGSTRLSLDYNVIFQNQYLIMGILLYGLGAMFLMYSLKNAALSYAYPFMSLNFMWVSILSYVVLKEEILLLQVIGIIIIIIGVILIGLDKDTSGVRA